MNLEKPDIIALANFLTSQEILNLNKRILECDLTHLALQRERSDVMEKQLETIISLLRKEK